MLFKTIDEIKSFLPIGAGNDFNRLKPHIENAENKYIKPLLSAAVFDNLQSFYDTDYPASPTDTDKAYKALLSKIQHAVIHLAYYVGFDFLNVSVSDAGFQRTESQSQKGLFKYQEDNLKSYFSNAGFNSLDDVLEFLEQNITHFDEFKNSPNWTFLKSAFIPTTRVLEETPFNIQGSRLIFLALKPHLSFIEDTVIKHTLGVDIYNSVKENMAAEQPQENILNLLPYIRKPLIYLATAEFMEESGADLTEKGLFFSSVQPVASGQNITKKEPSSEQRIAAMILRNRKIGNSYLDALKSYLSENWADYIGSATSAITRDNTNKRTFFA